MFLLKLLAIAIIAEFAGMLIYSGKAASGITWFLSHPFGIETTMFRGLLARAVLLILSAIILF